jgi:hypothetical protein
MQVIVRKNDKGSEIEMRDARVLTEVVRALKEMLAEADGMELSAKRGPGRPPKVQVVSDGAPEQPESAS